MHNDLHAGIEPWPRPLQCLGHGVSSGQAHLRLIRTLAVVAFAFAVGACSGDGVAKPVITLGPPTTPALSEGTTTSTTVLPEELVEAITVTPEDDLGAVVNAAEEGTTFLLAAGVHRLHTIIPKDGMTFVGSPGAVMSGAQIVDGFVPDGSNWRLDGVEMTGFRHGECGSDYTGCSLTQDLFMDDVMLWQVTSPDELEEGYWYWDESGIYVVNDPTSRKVELSITEHAFVGDADDVTIRDLVIEKYATPAQAGTVQAQLPGDGERGKRWEIRDVEIAGSHGVAIRTGDDTTVSGVYVHHNGQLGVTIPGGTGVVLEDSEIAFNNIAGFDWGWEAGGLKATRTNGLVIRNNHVHDNNGPGLWTDIDAVDTLFEGNVVTDNEGVGIFHEISGSAIIRRNTVERNGFGKPEWLWGAGILVAASNNVEIYENLVFDNADGIAGIQQERGDGPYGPRLLRDVVIHDNTIRMPSGQTGVVDDTGGDAVFREGNIVFRNNTYVDVSGRRFAWDGHSLDRAAWLRVGQDEGAQWESTP